MFWIFKSKPLLSEGDLEFQVETYKWLLTHFGGAYFYEGTSLILPTKEFFPSKVSSEEEAALEAFLAVKKYSGLENWPCKLEAQESDPTNRVAPTLAIQNAPSFPAGIFHLGEEEITITYNPALVSQPVQLVATYAHELAHYLTAATPSEPPGGWENWEFATDIAATFLGFGVFMANSTFNFSQFTDTDSQGWRYNRSGYLSELEHIYSLALFLLLKGISLEKPLPHLKGHLRKNLKTAVKEISRTRIVEDLKLVQYIGPTHNKNG